KPELEAIYIYFGKNEVAYAIAMAENGLDCTAVSKTNDHGLFQINAVHKGKFRGDVYDCYENTRVAYEIYKKQGWRPWSAYENGRYLNFLSQAKEIVKNYFSDR
ncbi:MAG: transglycosylase SLT domain-containing protein, partial [Candidatus Ratteibacteria bacterium]